MKTAVSSLSLLQEIFPTQELNPGLLHCRQMLLPSEPPGKSPSSQDHLFTHFLIQSPNADCLILF